MILRKVNSKRNNFVSIFLSRGGPTRNFLITSLFNKSTDLYIITRFTSDTYIKLLRPFASIRNWNIFLFIRIVVSLPNLIPTIHSNDDKYQNLHEIRLLKGFIRNTHTNLWFEFHFFLFRCIQQRFIIIRWFILCKIRVLLLFCAYFSKANW